MLSITIGPLAFPLPPLLMLGALLVGASLARRLVPAPSRNRAETSVWLAALCGLVAARAGHVLRHADVYMPMPLAALDIRDGGWLAPAGVVVGMAVLAWRARGWPEGRRALAAAGVVGIGLWLGLSLVFERFSPAPMAERVPALPLVALHDGGAATLDAVVAGRPAVVNLWATWCGPCREEMPVLAAAQQRHPGVRVVFLNQGEDAATVSRYLARENLRLEQVWLDATAAAGPAFGSRGLPTTFFIDAEGRRVDAHFGVLNAAALEARLAALGWSGPR